MSRTIPPWMVSLKQAIQKGFETDSNPTYFQFASVRSDGKPSVRTVVFRGCISETYTQRENMPGELDSNSLLSITTHFESKKVEELRRNNSFELTWWLPSAQEQYRISGLAHLIVQPDKVKEYPYPQHLVHFESSKKVDWEFQRTHFFEQMPPSLKASFLWPSPGEPLSKNGDFPYQLDDSKIDIAKENFVLVVLEPMAIDLVQLKHKDHRRFLYTRCNDENTKSSSNDPNYLWEAQELNP